MTWIRRVALALLLAAAVVVTIVAVVELWNYRQSDFVPGHASTATDLEQRARALEDRVEVLTRRVGDMQLLVVVLLGTSGLYAIVFVITSYFSAMSFARQADRSIAHIQDHIGIALGDLRELQEETQRIIDRGPALNAAKLEELRTETRAMIQEELKAHLRLSVNPETQLAAMLERISKWNPENMDEHAKLELVNYEDAAMCLELAVGSDLLPALASLYQSFARLYVESDKVRARFYLTRALKAAPPESALSSELHYDLACWFAGNRLFDQALDELRAAFQQQSRALDDRLAVDIDEGGKLDELASTPPFDKALNDLLLNVSVP